MDVVVMVGNVPGSVEILIQGGVASPSRRLGVLKPKGSNTMKTTTTSSLALATAANVHSLVELTEGFGQFCLMAGIARAMLQATGTRFKEGAPPTTDVRCCRIKRPGHQFHILTPKNAQHCFLLPNRRQPAPPGRSRICCDMGGLRRSGSSALNLLLVLHKTSRSSPLGSGLKRCLKKLQGGGTP